MEPCVPQGHLTPILAQLVASLEREAALEARIAELTRPKAPADYGLVVRLTPSETRIVMALLPPGEPLHVDALIRRAWPDIEAAGLVDESRHLAYVHMARVRQKLGKSGWRIPGANGHSTYVLLGPDDPLPFGFREIGGGTPHGKQDQRVPCPSCDGRMSREAKHCLPCARRLGALAARTCPACKGPKRPAARMRLCHPCNWKRKTGRLAGWRAA